MKKKRGSEGSTLLKSFEYEKSRDTGSKIGFKIEESSKNVLSNWDKIYDKYAVTLSAKNRSKIASTEINNKSNASQSTRRSR